MAANSDTLRWVRLIREALAKDDVGFAAEVAASLEHALVCAFDSGDDASQGVEPAPVSAAAATGVISALQGLAERVRNPQYDLLVEEMSGPPRFHLILAGEMEGPISSYFSHSVCTDGELERLLEWLRRTPELGPLLDAALDR